MSTHHEQQPQDQQPTERIPAEPGRKPDITVTKVAAGALASVTAAVAGSRLGVAGTITGAALVSIVSTVGTALYQHSMERTKDRVRTHAATLRQPPISSAQQAVLRRHRDAEIAEASPVTPWPGESADRRTESADSDTHAESVAADRVSSATERIAPPPAEATTASAREPVGPSATPERRSVLGRFRTTRWGLVAATAGLAFVAGMLGLTGIEMAAGHAVAGGPQGSTTVSLIGGGHSGGAPASSGTPGPAAPPATGASSAVPAAPGTAPGAGAPATGTPTETAPTTGAPAPSGSQPTVGGSPSAPATPSGSGSTPAPTVQPTLGLPTPTP